MSEAIEVAAPIEAAPSLEAIEAIEAIEESSPALEEGIVAEPVKQQEPAPPIKKQYKTKVNGKEQALDLSDDEVTQYIQKAMGADEKFAEAAMSRKQIEAFITDLKSNPLNVLRHPELGIDVKALAEQVLLAELQEAEKSPEQRKVEEMERKLKEYEEQAVKLEEEKRGSELARIKSEQFKKFDDDIVEALQGSSLPKSPYVVKRITDTLIEALNLKDDKGNQLYPNASVQDVMPYVEDLMRSEMEQMFQVMPTEMLEKLVGKNHLTTLRKNRVAASKIKPTSASDIKDTGGKESAAQKAEKQKTFEQMFGRF